MIKYLKVKKLSQGCDKKYNFKKIYHKLNGLNFQKHEKLAQVIVDKIGGMYF